MGWELGGDVYVLRNVFIHFFHSAMCFLPLRGSQHSAENRKRIILINHKSIKLYSQEGISSSTLLNCVQYTLQLHLHSAHNYMGDESCCWV